MVAGINASGDMAKAAEQIKALYKLFAESDCTMVEVNPLAEDAADEEEELDDDSLLGGVRGQADASDLNDPVSAAQPIVALPAFGPGALPAAGPGLAALL